MFLHVFGPRDLPRDPQETQEPKKCKKRCQKNVTKSAKNNPKKCLLGKKCLKPAISFLTIFVTNFGVQNCTFLSSFSNTVLLTFREPLEPMLGPILGPDRPKRDQDEPKRTIKSVKESNNCIFTQVVFALDIRRFFALRASQKRIKRPKKAPKRHPKNSKTPKKGPKIGPKNY